VERIAVPILAEVTTQEMVAEIAHLRSEPACFAGPLAEKSQVMERILSNFQSSCWWMRTNV
jgi:hypothetical protein